MGIKILGMIGQDTGYDFIPNPDEDIRPLTIINKSYDPIGRLDHFFSFPAGEDLTVKTEENKPDITQATVKGTDASLDAGLLKNILSVFYLGNISTKIELKKTRKIEMKFNNVRSDSVWPVEMAIYMKKGTLTKEEVLLDFISKKQETYLIYDILKSNSFSITLKDEDGGASKTDVSVIQGIASVKGDISIQHTDDATLTYSFEKPIAFGAKLWEFYVKESFFGKKSLITGEGGSLPLSSRTLSTYEVDTVSKRIPPAEGRSRSLDFEESVLKVPLDFSDFSASNLKPIRLDPEEYLKGKL
ncbi:MAG: hypothetical protein ABFC24_04030 [Methanoregulaceae archaeon]